jgi:CRP-like cAMP-binding protein
LDDPDLADLAARLLYTSQALGALTPRESRTAVSFMGLLQCGEGQVLIREGEEAADGFMLLILDGEVTVENLIDNRAAPVVASVLGPGQVVGETGVLDGGPRTATCTATTPVRAAELTARALHQLMQDAPAVAAKLLASVAERMALRLRDSGRQLRVYKQLLDAMQAEVDESQRQLHQVMGGALMRQRRPEFSGKPD